MQFDQTEMEKKVKMKREFFMKRGMNNPKKRMLHIIRRIHDKMEKDGNQKLKEFDLTLAQGHVLGFLLAHNGKASLKELERALNVAQSTSAGLVARLEKRGYIENLTDENDKRIKIVGITPSGLEVLHSIGDTMQEIERKIIAPLSEEERETFTNLLIKIGGGLDGETCK